MSGIIPVVAHDCLRNHQMNNIKRPASPSFDEGSPAFAPMLFAVLSTVKISAAFAYGVSATASVHE
jgi:hypothetical protein